MRRSCRSLLLVALCWTCCYCAASAAAENYRNKCWMAAQTRGGSSDTASEEQTEGEDMSLSVATMIEPTSSHPVPPPPQQRPRSARNKKKNHRSILKTRRRASQVIQQLVERSGRDEISLQSYELRKLFAVRAQQEVWEPKRLLHLLAPKIPAIQHSPDVALRIQSATSDMDSGVAAYLVGILARVNELYDKACAEQGTVRNGSHNSILHERRLEQVIECILCGVDVNKRKQNYLKEEQQMMMASATGASETIEDILDESNLHPVTEGLSVRDCCRAAWGMAILGVQQLGSIGGHKVNDILMALSLRTRELLLSRLQHLRQDDLGWDLQESKATTIEALIAARSEELAEDAASAMWAFACVRACAGIRFAPLFEACCSILCQNPLEMRRRAQSAEPNLKATTVVGSNDVVERLARAESSNNEGAVDSLTENNSDSVAHAGSEELEGKDTLIDYLSPKELTDVLWGVALHGSKYHDSSREEMALSETVAVFREIAFDRLVDWLNEELNLLQNYQDSANGGHSVTVEVVHAESLLSSDASIWDPSTRDIPVESILIENRQGDSVEEVQVIDAAAIMASAANDGRAVNGDVLSGVEAAATGQPVADDLSTRLSIFLPRDLCSIAWAVTELHDSLRSSITHIVSRIFRDLGPGSLRDLTGGDLSNLAWAIAKSTTVDATETDITTAIEVTEWIADIVVSTGISKSNGLSDALLRSFHPAELGRIMWAIAATLSWRSTDDSIASAATMARSALLASAESISLFGAEDLARVTWGFLELSDLSTVFDDQVLSLAVGKCLSAIEASLLDWESGTEAPRLEDASGGHSFSSFFGRARYLVPLLDQSMDDPTEDGDDLSLLLAARKKTALPMLKDLPLDPSTMCKLTCSFAKLHSHNVGLNNGETLARVALRLMTSRGSRLLRECPLHDLVRLCGAIATTDLSLGRERINLFVRRVVQLLNTMDFERNPLRPSERARLIWSLGRLGVKYAAEKENSATAHRRLQLTAVAPLVSGAELRNLTEKSLSQMLLGVVTTQLFSSNKAYAKELLDEVAQREYARGGVLCELFESTTLLKVGLADDQKRSQAEATKAAEETEGLEDLVKTGEAEQVGGGESVVSKELEDAGDRCLLALTVIFKDLVLAMSAAELRRVLAVCSLSPYNADDLVAAIKTEVERRVEELSSVSVDMATRMANLAHRSDRLLKRIQGDATTSRFAAIRASIKNLFSKETVEPEQQSEVAEDWKEIVEVLQSVSTVGQQATTMETASHSSLNATVRRVQQETLFELGRCRELISHYHRIDFASGHRTTRHEEDTRHNMAKRVLSRLLP